MVPKLGSTLNLESQLLAGQAKNNKTPSELPESPLGSHNIEELFNTLAEWNKFLENHVHFYYKPLEPGQ
jgi:hypothetical protein